MIALKLTDVEVARHSAAVVLPFHEAVRTTVRMAERVDVHFPPYRGMALIPMLSWLVVDRLAMSGAEVRWHMDRQQGPDSVQRRLHELGWTLTRGRSGRRIDLCGQPPAEAAQPTPAEVSVDLGDRQATLFADYGVFSPAGLDAGTDMLLRRALAEPVVDTVADVGVGYGPLAIALTVNQVAQKAIASDVDALALWLATENARRCGISLAVTLTEDPMELAPTPLTVCNVPTHIDRQATERLMGSLARRAAFGRLLIVVHGSLEARYSRHLQNARLVVRRYPGTAHVVLEARRG